MANTDVTAPVPQVFGCDVPARQRTVKVWQSQSVQLTWTMLDNTGQPLGNTVDLNTVADACTLRVIEAVSFSTTNGPIVIEGDFDGSMNCVFDIGPNDVTKLAGIYLAEAAIYDGDGALRYVNQFYIFVDRSVGALTQQLMGMPTLAEIRLHMRDSDPSENSSTLEDVQFDPSEIAACIVRPILYWNETNPPLNFNYTTENFPHRYNWLDGIVAQLYLIAAHWYRRNRLPLEGQGGTMVDDLNKAQEYEAIAKQKWEDYKAWVLTKKVQINALGAIQSSFSPCVYGGW